MQARCAQMTSRRMGRVLVHSVALPGPEAAQLGAVVLSPTPATPVLLSSRASRCRRTQVLAPCFATCRLPCRGTPASLDVDGAHHGDAGRSIGGDEPLAARASCSDGEVEAFLQAFHRQYRGARAVQECIERYIPLSFDPAVQQLVEGMARWFERAGAQGEA